MLREPLLLRVSRPLEDRLIRAAADGLSPGVRCKFLSLADKDPVKTPEGIFISNYFEVDGDGGVYERICRVNHSCQPNCAHAFDAAASVGELRAVNEISAGEELYLTYIALSASLAERRRLLQEKYGFLCSCESCRKRDVLSDLRRTAIRQCDNDSSKAFEAIAATDASLTKRRNTRAQGLRRCAETLRLIAAESLESVEDTDARACSSMSYLLSGNPELQAQWIALSVARFAVGGCAKETQQLKAELSKSILMSSAELLPIHFDVTD